MSDLQVPDELVTLLTGAGLRATLELRDVNPPAVLVVPRRVDAVTRHRRTISVDMIAWAPGAVGRGALSTLDTMAEVMTGALEAAGIAWESGEWLARPNPLTGDDQMTYTLTVTRTY